MDRAPSPTGQALNVQHLQERPRHVQVNCENSEWLRIPSSPVCAPSSGFAVPPVTPDSSPVPATLHGACDSFISKSSFSKSLSLRNRACARSDTKAPSALQVQSAGITKNRRPANAQLGKDTFTLQLNSALLSLSQERAASEGCYKLDPPAPVACRSLSPDKLAAALEQVALTPHAAGSSTIVCDASSTGHVRGASCNCAGAQRQEWTWRRSLHTLSINSASPVHPHPLRFSSYMQARARSSRPARA